MISYLKYIKNLKLNVYSSKEIYAYHSQHLDTKKN